MLMPASAAVSRNQTSNPSRDAHLAALARLLPLWPHELSDPSPAGFDRRLSLLRKALRAERHRGLAGHWTYDLGRHSALLRCYQQEAAYGAAKGATSRRAGP